ncbi:MAG: UDP-N-acetylmuramoyl-L-alanyl-D-glutamate--2,6-diaminopimelate ligase [Oscillospiraceae bacterium]|nr:UDP-N-acetylmuramoyl-L-alanyl-D-glutamate--2,6-diaminopimelate ligase [Oscillospiraceae bacterium]
MRLSALLKKAAVTSANVPLDTEVTALTDDSRKVSPGCVFVCVKGRSFDGHGAVPDALKAGAAAIVTERDLGLPQQVIVDDTRTAYALMCSAFFGDPCESLKIIGVTGTNGKTTTCFLMRDMLAAYGKKTGLIGSVYNMIGNEELSAEFTTPGPYELHSLFRQMADAGCEYCVMEASSQALEQRRVHGVRFEAAIFTNLTRDHLDYHGTFENYLAAKRILFENTDLAVINLDDGHAAEIIGGLSCPAVTFSMNRDEADYTAKNIQIKSTGTEYELVGEGVIARVKCRTPGRFTVYNSMGAIVCLTRLGIPFAEAVALVSESGGCVPGRAEIVPASADYTVIIDHAHTPDGLKNILEALREITAGRVITVFGCGGDRDKTKRPLMGGMAVQLSDAVIVTSDNPRTEDPERIIDEIMAGIDKPRIPVCRVTDRREAIKKALKKAKAGDIVLLAGKGQETYQIIGTEKLEMDERKIVSEILNG